MIRYRPGQELKTFTIKKNNKSLDAKGRPMSVPEATTTSFKGMISAASQREVQQWKELGHPISHTVASRDSAAMALQAEDIITTASRKFYVQGVTDPGELGIYAIAYCEERFDAK
ncbi:MAG: hypothetical protein VB031_02180 [Eubacteriaceae bacterium]|nr:hypothetical protein [Eubacteriaceae bacterium]